MRLRALRRLESSYQYLALAVVAVLVLPYLCFLVLLGSTEFLFRRGFRYVHGAWGWGWWLPKE